MSTFAYAVLWNAGAASGLALAVALAGRSRFLQRRPAVVHALWLLVLAKLITPPLLPVPVPGGVFHEEAAASVQAGASGTKASEPLPPASKRRSLEAGARAARLATVPSAEPTSWNASWTAILGGVSASGTLLLIGWAIAQSVRVSRILSLASCGDERLIALGQAAAARMGMRVTPLVCTVDAPLTPMLWASAKGPFIVLPLRLVRQMDDQQLTCILCHELAHWVRRDLLSNMFAFGVNALFWWHPVAWWARQQMRAAQEVCCDGQALVTGKLSRRCYAETLFQALNFVNSDEPVQPALASGFGGTSSLKRRFEMIGTIHVGHKLSLIGAMLAVVGVAPMLCLPVGAQVNVDLGGWEESSSIKNEHPVNIVACDVDWIALGDEGGNVFAWDAKTLNKRKLLMKGVRDGGNNSSVDRFQISPDGRSLFAVLDNYHSMWQLHLTDDFDRPSNGVADDEPSFIGFSSDGAIWLERHLDKTYLALRDNPRLPGAQAGFKGIQYAAEILHADLSDNVQRLAVLTADETLHTYDRASLRELHAISLADQPVLALQLSSDGKQLAVVGERGFAKVFDTDSGKEIAALNGHKGIVFAVAFSPDGKTIATGGSDNTVRLWDVASGKSAAVLEGHKDAVRAVAFNPTGDVVVTGSSDSTVKVWKRR